MASVKVYHTLNKRVKPRKASNGVKVWPLNVTILVGQKNTNFKSFIYELFNTELGMLNRKEEMLYGTILDDGRLKKDYNRVPEYRSFESYVLLDEIDINKSKVIKEYSKPAIEKYLKTEVEVISNLLNYLDPLRPGFEYKFLTELMSWMFRSLKQNINAINIIEILEVLESKYRIECPEFYLKARISESELRLFLSKLFVNHPNELNYILPNKYSVLKAYLQAEQEKLLEQKIEYDKEMKFLKTMDRSGENLFEQMYYNHYFGDLESKFKEKCQGHPQEKTILKEYEELAEKLEQRIRFIKHRRHENDI